ncbi:DnaJ-domain-containing protein [Daldinia loculata]|uniref:DnaJ-domain-containing protein n=1 Tax=Daldinia loculata TaxID=103429 RepID=UPI0020C23F21|nr:DnaJ-domain-containing protein [Daldinia loculata]KAI1645477.1 DnaJ-domain-containing protein [Daldinia loculata]KAI2776825.1 DnaJ-domain-containing protein [Daldinia loculata]
MTDRAPPNYYKILEISESSTTQQIRDAYKRAALKTHPDRVPSNSPERPVRTRKFQLVNDAYYTLSDTTRRREYDAQRRRFGGGRSTYTYEEADDPEESVPPETGGGGTGAAQSAYSWAWNFFTGGNTNSQPHAREARQQTEDAQFGAVFEEMLREEGLADQDTNRPTSKFWSILGAASGSVLGFILANMPGAVAGAVAGNRLGAVRDAKGKSVYAVFQELPQDDRARMLAQLATRVFSHAVGI